MFELLVYYVEPRAALAGMLVAVISSALIGLLSLAVAALEGRRRAHTRLAAYGVPVPQPVPSLLAGHFSTLRPAQMGGACPVDVMTSWQKLCGKIYGLYFGPTPVVVLGDAVEVERVMARSGKVCPDRPPLAIPVAPITESIVGLRGADWRRVRRLMNPKFAPDNSKALLEPVIHKKLDSCVTSIKESIKSSKIVDAIDISESLSFEVVCSAVLGIEPEPELFAAVRSFLARNLDGAIRSAIYCTRLVLSAGNVAKLNPVASAVTSLAQRFGFHPKASKMLLQKVKKAVEERKRKQQGLPEVQTFAGRCPFENMWAKLSGKAGDESLNAGKLKEIQERHNDVLQGLINDHLDGKMSQEEVIANAWVLLLGGFDTVAQALSFTLYLLAKHPESQEKVLREVKANIQDPERADINEVTKLSYLDKVVKESLRMYPPVNLNTSRHCVQDIQLKTTGGVIPAGANIHVPIWQIHRNPEYWDRPDEFVPERFDQEIEKKRPKMAYIPFGVGSRYCIGKHLALMEIKMAVVRLLSNFKFELADSDEKLDLVLPLVTLKTANGIRLRCHERHKIDVVPTRRNASFWG